MRIKLFSLLFHISFDYSNFVPGGITSRVIENAKQLYGSLPNFRETIREVVTEISKITGT